VAGKKNTQFPEGTNPLDRLAGNSKQGKASKASKASKKDLPSKKDSLSTEELLSKEDLSFPSARVNYAFKCNEFLLEKLRDIAYWERITMADLLDDAVFKIIQEYEKSNGEPYEKRASKLRTGRPPK
jgi:hypothetical protein